MKANTIVFASALAAALTSSSASPPAALPDTLAPDAAQSVPGARLQTLPGLVVPAAQVTVRAQSDGVVAGPASRVGDSVAACDVVARLDDGALALECERQKARLAALGHHVVSAKADLMLCKQKGRQLKAAGAKGAVAAFELMQNDCQIEAARARVRALEEESREEAIRALGLERQRQALRVTAPIDGEVVEAGPVPGVYVRAGEPLAKIRSIRRHVRVNLPASLAPDLPRLRFALAAPGGSVALEPVEVRPDYNLNGARSIALAVPAAVELTVGQAVYVEVIAP
jgi:multidrug efflux pump subunit AcrA (membrane-fusion protein)